MKKSLLHIGKELKNIREGLGISQKNLSLNSNLSVDTIIRMEKNKFFPRVESFINILDNLGMDFENIFLFSCDSKLFSINEKIKDIRYNLKILDIDKAIKEIEELIYISKMLDEDFWYKKIILENILYFKAIINNDVDKNSNKALVLLEKSLNISCDKFNLNDIEKFNYLKLSDFQKVAYLKILEILDFKLFEIKFMEFEKYLQKDFRYYTYCIYQKIKIKKRNNDFKAVQNIINENMDKIKFDYCDYILFSYIKYTCDRKNLLIYKNKALKLCELFELERLKMIFEKDLNIEDLIMC